MVLHRLLKLDERHFELSGRRVKACHVFQLLVGVIHLGTQGLDNRPGAGDRASNPRVHQQFFGYFMGRQRCTKLGEMLPPFGDVTCVEGLGEQHPDGRVLGFEVIDDTVGTARRHVGHVVSLPLPRPLASRCIPLLLPESPIDKHQHAERLMTRCVRRPQEGSLAQEGSVTPSEGGQC
jgi:hypothetical protein